MKTIEQKSEGSNYVHASVGKIAELGEHSLVLAPGVEIPGKVFTGSALHTTGSELSFQSFAPGSETGFYHIHKTHEELYIFIAGNGEFQVNDIVFPISEGSIVKVDPKGKRSVRNTGNSPLVMICIQYKANSFSSIDAQDGEILKEQVQW